MRTIWARPRASCRSVLFGIIFSTPWAWRTSRRTIGSPFGPQRVPKPHRERPGPHAHPPGRVRPPREPPRDRVQAGRRLALREDRPAGVDDRDRRPLLRHVQSCKHAHVILRRSGVGAAADAATPRTSTAGSPREPADMAITLSGVGGLAFGEALAGQAAVVGSLAGSVCAPRALASRDMRRRVTARSSPASSTSAPVGRMTAASLDEMPTTSERRLISRPTALGRVGARDLGPVLAGEVHGGQHVLARGVHHLPQLGVPGAERVGDLAPLPDRGGLALPGKDGLEHRGHRRAVLGPDMSERAPRPSARGSAGASRREPAPRRPAAPCGRRPRRASRRAARSPQPAAREAAGEPGPEDLGLGRPRGHAQHLAPAVQVHTHGPMTARLTIRPSSRTFRKVAPSRR